MDPSATLLNILHKNQSSSEASSAAQGQVSPNQPATQQQGSALFAYAPTYGAQTQLLGTQLGYIPAGSVPPHPPLPLPSQPLAASPSSPFVSLLSNLNPMSTNPTASSSSTVSNMPPAEGASSASLSVHHLDPTLNVDKESTESLKLALFGPSQSAPNAIQDVQQGTTVRSTAEPPTSEGDANDENGHFLDVAVPQERGTSPVEEVDYDKLSETISSITPSTSADKEPSSPVTKSRFTYTNPFDMFKKSPPSSPPSGSHVHAKKESLSSTSKDGGVNVNIASHPPVYLTSISAWRIRETMMTLRSGVPEGARLQSGDVVYECAARNEMFLSSSNLEDNVTSITILANELDYRSAKLIAVNQHYICYAVKGGKVRAISISYGTNALLRNCDAQIVDMCIQDSSQGSELCTTEDQWLLVIGQDSKITVWDLTDLGESSSDTGEFGVILFEIDGKEPQNDNRTPRDNKNPRYVRAAWHPLNRNVFAVATDTNEVLVVDITKVNEGSGTRFFKENLVLKKVLKTDKHLQSIEDVRFSPDGTTLAVANGDEVVFWDLSQLTEMGASRGPLRTVNLDGERASTVFFVASTDQLHETLSSSSLSSYVIIATERNTRVHLRDIEEGKDVQTITFLPPKERRPSLTKAFRRQPRMFNCISFDLRTQTLVVCNSYRVSIFSLHLDIQARQFDHMVELPLQHPVNSFVTVPELINNARLSAYCMQTPGVFQYHLGQDHLLPKNIEDCPEFISAPRPPNIQGGDAENESEDADKADGSADSAAPKEADQDDGVQRVVEKVTAKETVVAGTTVISDEFVSENSHIRADGGEQAPDKTASSTLEAQATSQPAKRVPLTGTSGMTVDVNPGFSDDGDGKSAEQTRPITTAGIKLSGPVVNSTIAKLKERKKAEKAERERTPAGAAQLGEAVSDSEKVSRKKESRRSAADREKDGNEAEASNRAATKKSAESKNSGKVTNEKTKKTSETQQDNTGGKNMAAKAHTSAKQGSSSGVHDAASNHESSSGTANRAMAADLGKELKKVEDGIINKVGKLFAKEMDKQCQEIKAERVQHQAMETQRQETILKVVSQTLNNNTAQLLTQTIRTEIANTVVPVVTKALNTTVEKQIRQGLPDAINKNLPTTIERTVAENIQKVLSKSTVIDSIAKGVSRALKPTVDEIFKDNFANMLIPAHQSATNAMFEQINRSLEAGLRDIAQRSAPVAAGSTIDANAFKQLQASVEQLATSIQQLQQSQQHIQAALMMTTQPASQQTIAQPVVHAGAQTSAHANLSDHSTENPEHNAGGRAAPDYPLHSHSLARSLSGELKRILIPNVASATPRAPPLPHQDGYSLSSVGQSTMPPRQSHTPHSQLQQYTTLPNPAMRTPYHPHYPAAQVSQVQQSAPDRSQRQNLSPVQGNMSRQQDSNYEEMFIKALSANDTAIVLQLCARLDPKTLFLRNGRSLVSQAVILSLLHHLSMDLEQYLEMKLSWLEDLADRIELADPTTQEHVPRILADAKQRLEQRYYKLGAEDTKNPNLQRLMLLIYNVNGRLAAATMS